MRVDFLLLSFFKAYSGFRISMRSCRVCLCVGGKPKGKMFHEYVGSLPKPLRYVVWSSPQVSLAGFVFWNRAYYFPSYYSYLPSKEGILSEERQLFGVDVVPVTGLRDGDNIVCGFEAR